METNFAIATLETELRAMEYEEGHNRSFDEPKADAAAVAAAEIRQAIAILRAALGGPIWPEPTGDQPKPDWGIGAPPDQMQPVRNA